MLLSEPNPFWAGQENLFWCGGGDLNPYALWAPAPQAGASANFATSARGELDEYTKGEGTDGAGAERLRIESKPVQRAGCASGWRAAGCWAASIRARSLFSASALKYLQSSRIKTEVYGMAILVLRTRI